MKKQVKCPDDEPKQNVFLMPSIGEHSFQVMDVNQDKVNADLVLVKLEVCSAFEKGRSILHRISLDDSWRGFFTTRLFLKAINEPHKGDVSIDTDNWIGRSFVASVKHVENKEKTKTYANIDTFNFDAVAEIAAEPSGNEPLEQDWEE